jgi:hypothetical protein
VSLQEVYPLPCSPTIEPSSDFVFLSLSLLSCSVAAQTEVILETICPSIFGGADGHDMVFRIENYDPPASIEVNSLKALSIGHFPPPVNAASRRQ